MAVDVVLGTVAEFIEISQTIVALFIIYYLIKFIFYSPKGADEEWGAQGAAAREAVGKLIKESKEKKDKKDKVENRKKYLEKCSGFLHRALSASQDLQEYLHSQKQGEVNKTKSKIGDLKNALSSARSNARVAHRYHKDNLTQSIHRTHAAIDAVYEKIEELLSDNVPNVGDSDFKQKGAKMRAGATKMSNFIASLFDSVMKYINAHDDEVLKISAEIETLEREAAAKHAANQAAPANTAQAQAQAGAAQQAQGGSSGHAAPRPSRVRFRRGNPPATP